MGVFIEIVDFNLRIIGMIYNLNNDTLDYFGLLKIIDNSK